MNEGTKTALRASIQHWKDVANSTTLYQHGIGVKDCALCRRFNQPGMTAYYMCGGCPVKDYTGRKGCVGTPHEAVAAAQDQGDLSWFLSAAQEEVEFLESLLPDGDTPPVGETEQ